MHYNDELIKALGIRDEVKEQKNVLQTKLAEVWYINFVSFLFTKPIFAKKSNLKLVIESCFEGVLYYNLRNLVIFGFETQLCHLSGTNFEDSKFI